MFTEPRRAWIYRTSTAGLPLLVAYGVLTESVVPLWAAFLGAALVPGLAAAHTSTRKTP